MQGIALLFLFCSDIIIKKAVILGRYSFNYKYINDKDLERANVCYQKRIQTWQRGVRLHTKIQRLIFMLVPCKPRHNTLYINSVNKSLR